MMYKYHNKNGYDVMEYDFNSQSELLDYIDTAPFAKAWDGKDKASEKIDYDGWRGTKDFQEAYDLCRYGQYDSGFDHLGKLTFEVDRYIKEAKRLQPQKNDYIGYAPDVASFLNGFPLDMFNHIEKKQKRKKVDIFFNCSQSSDTQQGQIFNKGAILLSTIKYLENIGIDTNLTFFEMSRYYKQLFFAKILVKKENQHLDMRSAYFPICNPSLLRRIIHRLKEKTPDVESAWTNTYGYPCDLEDVKKFIKTDKTSIIFNTTKEMNIHGQDLYKDAESAFKFIERTSKLSEIGVDFSGLKKDKDIGLHC